MIIWVITIFFVEFFCVFLPPLLNIFCFCWPVPFCPLLCPSLHDAYLNPTFAHLSLVSLIFLKPSLVFPILSFSSISLHWSLRKAFLFLFAVLWNSAFKSVYLSFSPLPLASLLFSAICKFQNSLLGGKWLKKKWNSIYFILWLSFSLYETQENDIHFIGF